MLHTLGDIYDGWAIFEMPKDGFAGMNLTKPSHQIVRFIGVIVLINLVDLIVFGVFVRDALESSLRNFDVLYGTIAWVNALFTWK